MFSWHFRFGIVSVMNIFYLVKITIPYILWGEIITTMTINDNTNAGVNRIIKISQNKVLFQ